MARYQRPPDPRDPEFKTRRAEYRRDGRGQREPIPWLWLGLGIVATIIAVALAGILITLFLFQCVSEQYPGYSIRDSHFK